MDITHIKNLAKALFKGREQEIEKNQKFCLNIGEIKAKLDTRRKIRLQNFSGRTIVSDSIESNWKKETGNYVVNPEEEPNPHIVITGMSGMGKSTLLKSILSDIGKGGIGALVFDAHNEHSKAVKALNGKAYDSKYAGINIFELDGMSVGERSWELTRLFGSVFSLGHIQMSKLHSCIKYVYRFCGAKDKNAVILEKTPTIANLMNELDIFIKNARTSTEALTIQNMKSKIEMLNTSTFSKSRVSLKNLLSGVNSFSMQNLKSSEARQIYLHELLRRLYYNMKDNEKETGLKLYVIMDEAQSLMMQSENGSVVANIIQEGRKYGVGSVIATHLSSALDRQIVANAATFITFHCRDPREINYVAAIVSGGVQNKANLIKSALSLLGQNEAIILSGKIRCAMIVRTPTIYKLDPVIAGTVDETPSFDEAAECRILDFLNEPVLEQTAKTYLNKDFSIVEEMMNERIINKFSTDDSDGKQTWLMRDKYSPSIEHEVYVKKISKLFERFGINNQIIGGPSRPDLTAKISGNNIAVEYETGKRQIDTSFEMFMKRLQEFDAVVVVVNEASVDNYKKKVSNGRIIVVSYQQLVQCVWSKNIIPKKELLHCAAEKTEPSTII